MKKVYSLLALLVAFIASATAQVTVVTSIGPAVKSIDELKEGDKIALFCYGEESRRAYICEQDNQKLKLSRNLVLNETSSADYIFTVLSVAVGEDGTSADLKLQTPRGNYMPNFPYDESSTWTKWPGATALSADSAATITMLVTTEADSLFYFKDENAVFFNGQNIDDSGYANFVGWDSEGANSLYCVYPLTTETKTSWTTTLYLQTTDGEEIENKTVTSVVGTVIDIPTVENFTFDHADNYILGDELELPYTFTEYPEEGYFEIGIYYKQNPVITLYCQDGEGNSIKEDNFYVPFGYTFNPDSIVVGLGYVLDAADNVAQVINEDAEITLHYTKTSTGGLPFVPATIENGAFAAGTHFYTLKVRGGYTYYQTGDASLKVANDFQNTDSIDTYLWAIAGDLENGFQIYNKALGAGYQMYAASTADGTEIQVGTPEEIAAVGEAITTFQVTVNGTGYSIAAFSEATACMNRFGGATGPLLKFWNDGNSPTDIGSRFVFAELSDEEANILTWSKANVWLNTENCVGGYTTEQLATLKQAVTAKDIDAANTAIANLQADNEPIAFDATKQYYIVSAFKNFVLKQPGTTYAIGVDATDTLHINKLTTETMTDANYRWEFYAASDTTYFIGNVGQPQKPIASFRFGGNATLVGATTDKELGENEIWPVGGNAPFELQEADAAVAPAAFYLVHNYGPSHITLCGRPVNGDGTDETGYITTYNTKSAGYCNVWRLKLTGVDCTNGINNATVAEGAADQPIYDLSGRRVAKAQKGIYIQGGKKVLVK